MSNYKEKASSGEHLPVTDILNKYELKEIVAWNYKNNNVGEICKVCGNSRFIYFEFKDNFNNVAKCPYCYVKNWYEDKGIELHIQKSLKNYWRGFYQGFISRQGVAEYLQEKSEYSDYNVFACGFKPCAGLPFYHRLSFIDGFGSFQLKLEKDYNYNDVFTKYMFEKIGRIQNTVP